MSDSTSSPSVSSGIEGLDQLLRSGLPAHRMHLIEGVPGSGKTTLAMQFLLDGRDKGEPVLYITLSETTAELQGVARSHGWSLEGIELYQMAAAAEKTSEEYTLYHPAEVELADLTRTVLDRVEAVRPSRVVFDSLSELRLLARDPLRYRRQILGLKEFFAGRDTTVLLLDDHSAGHADLQLQSLAHGVIRLEVLPFEYGRARRRLRIVKMRGVAVTEGFHDFAILRGGLEVYPQLRPGSATSPRPDRPVESGIAELDSLLGGGLTWGSVTTFIGPAGAGKSTLAAQYATAAAHNGEKAAVFLFDERRSTFLGRGDALGMRTSEAVKAGTLIVEQVEPGDTSPGQFSHRVRECVEQNGVTVVTIDTLNGYLSAIPTTDVPLVRLHELLSYLNEAHVATLVIVAQHGIIGATMPVPLDISYLADAAVLLRFFEAQGEVRKAISVVKKRTGAHECTIREFQIGPDRVYFGDPLVEFHGVLTGVPRYVGEGGPLLSHAPSKPRS
jgi:circadian clock protein KaiC